MRHFNRETKTRDIEVDVRIAERGVDGCLNGPSVNEAARLDGRRRARVGHRFLLRLRLRDWLRKLNAAEALNRN